MLKQPPRPLPRGGEDTAAVVVLAVLAVGERSLLRAKPLLTRLLECRHVRVRAAAAATILRIGWGVGLGQVSSVALSLLEQMCGVTLGERPPNSPQPPPFLSPGLRGRSTFKSVQHVNADKLRATIARLTNEWELLTHSDLGQVPVTVM